VPGKHLAILTHKNSFAFNKERYLMRFLCERWQARGNRVSIISDIQQKLDADAILLHVDLTTITDDYLQYLDSYPRSINKQTRNIAKTSFSQQLLTRDSGYHGPVIIKTDANYGGKPDLIASSPIYAKVDTIRNKLGFSQPWHKIQILDSLNYPIFDYLQQVPAGVWENPALIVEKFIPEQNDAGDYYLRVWYFFGTREFIEFDTSSQPTVKGSTTFSRKQDDYVPEDLRQLRRKMGFDYGKFDFAIVDGTTILYDINRTPTVGRTTTDKFHQALLEELSYGFEEFLE
jgi:hypothetical protein